MQEVVPNPHSQKEETQGREYISLNGEQVESVQPLLFNQLLPQQLLSNLNKPDWIVPAGASPEREFKWIVSHLQDLLYYRDDPTLAAQAGRVLYFVRDQFGLVEFENAAIKEIYSQKLDSLWNEGGQEANEAYEEILHRQRAESASVEINGLNQSEHVGPTEKQIKRFHQVIDRARRAAESVYQSDSEQLRKEEAKLEDATAQVISLHINLADLALMFNKKVEGSRVRLSSLPINVQETLMKGQDELELLNRMMARLPTHPLLPARDIAKSVALPTFDQLELEQTVKEASDEEQAQKVANKIVRNYERKCYEPLQHIREETQKREKTFRSFLEKQVLPVADGVEEAMRHNLPLVTQLRRQNVEAESEISQWSFVYGDLKDSLISSLLSNMGVRQMQIRKSDPVDYSYHEVFDSEPAPEQADETIISVLRSGYILREDDGKEPQVLRPAQVVVAKNQ
jgi:molecular chaperone GrpE (heat shock protein)